MKKKNWLVGLLAILLFLLVFSFLLKDKYLFSGFLFAHPTPTISPSPSPNVDIFSPDKPTLSSLKYVDMAKKSLAARLRINISEVTVINITKKTWGDTSLGCPEGDRMYAQVITPGYVIELTAKGKNYIYHAGLERVFSCKDS